MPTIDERVAAIRANPRAFQAPVEWTGHGLGNAAEAGILNFFGAEGANPEARRAWESQLNLGEALAKSYEAYAVGTGINESDAMVHTLTMGGTIKDPAEIQKRVDALSIVFPEIRNQVQPPPTNAPAQSAVLGATPQDMTAQGEQVSAPPAEAAGPSGTPSQGPSAQPTGTQPEAGGATLPGGGSVNIPPDWRMRLTARVSRGAYQEASKALATGGEPATTFQGAALGLPTQPIVGTEAAQAEQARKLELGAQGEAGAKERAQIAASASEFGSTLQYQADMAKVGAMNRELDLKYNALDGSDLKGLAALIRPLAQLRDKSDAQSSMLLKSIVYNNPAVQKILGVDSEAAAEAFGTANQGLFPWLYDKLFSGGTKLGGPKAGTTPGMPGNPTTSPEAGQILKDLQDKQGKK